MGRVIYKVLCIVLIAGLIKMAIETGEGTPAVVFIPLALIGIFAKER